MKTIALIISMMTFLAPFGFSQDLDINALLENSGSRGKIFSAILSDQELLKEFIKDMKESDAAVMIPQSCDMNSGVVSHMICGMMDMKEKNQVCHKMTYLMSGPHHNMLMCSQMMEPPEEEQNDEMMGPGEQQNIAKYPEPQMN